MGVSENRENPFLPNGFADQTIPMKNGYFIGKINPIFRQTHMSNVLRFLHVVRKYLVGVSVGGT